jgi:hypothetical protein
MRRGQSRRWQLARSNAEVLEHGSTGTWDVGTTPRSSVRRRNPIAGPLEHRTDGARDRWSMRPPALSQSGWNLPGSHQLPSVATTSSGLGLEHPLTSGVSGRSGAAFGHWNTGPSDQGHKGSPEHDTTSPRPKRTGFPDYDDHDLRSHRPATHCFVSAHLFPGSTLEHTGIRDHRNAGHGSNATARHRSESAMWQNGPPPA